MWFSASETSAALVLCFAPAAPVEQNKYYYLGPTLNNRSARWACSLQTDPQEESGPAGSPSDSQIAFISPGMKVKASILKQETCVFPADRRPPAPPADTTHFAHPASLELKINWYALKNTQTHLQHTPSRVSAARDTNPSGPGVHNALLPHRGSPAPSGGLEASQEPTPRTRPLRLRRAGLEAPPRNPRAPATPPFPDSLKDASGVLGHQAQERPLLTQRAPILPALRASARPLAKLLFLSCHSPRGLWFILSSSEALREDRGTDRTSCTREGQRGPGAQVRARPSRPPPAPAAPRERRLPRRGFWRSLAPAHPPGCNSGSAPAPEKRRERAATHRLGQLPASVLAAGEAAAVAAAPPPPASPDRATASRAPPQPAAASLVAAANPSSTHPHTGAPRQPLQGGQPPGCRGPSRGAWGFAGAVNTPGFCLGAAARLIPCRTPYS